MHVAGYPKYIYRSSTFDDGGVFPNALVLEGVALMHVLSMLRPFSTERL